MKVGLTIVLKCSDWVLSVTISSMKSYVLCRLFISHSQDRNSSELLIEKQKNLIKGIVSPQWVILTCLCGHASIRSLATKHMGFSQALDLHLQQWGAVTAERGQVLVWFVLCLCVHKVLEAVLYMRRLLEGAHIWSRNSEDRCSVGKGQVYGHSGEWRLWSFLFWKYGNVQFLADSREGGKPQKNTFS